MTFKKQEIEARLDARAAKRRATPLAPLQAVDALKQAAADLEDLCAELERLGLEARVSGATGSTLVFQVPKEPSVPGEPKDVSRFECVNNRIEVETGIKDRRVIDSTVDAIVTEVEGMIRGWLALRLRQ